MKLSEICSAHLFVLGRHPCKSYASDHHFDLIGSPHLKYNKIQSMNHGCSSKLKIYQLFVRTSFGITDFEGLATHFKIIDEGSKKVLKVGSAR